VANHAGAVPMDAPVIMHGVEEEIGRIRQQVQEALHDMLRRRSSVRRG